MSRIQIPLDALTSRLNLQDRLQGLRSGPLSGRFANLRPISEFCDFKRLSKPENFGDAQSRVNYNLSYFSTNYLVVFAMLSIYSLLTNWILLFDIIFVFVGMFVLNRLDGRDLELGTFRATSSQLQTGLFVIAVPLFLFASPFTTLLWLIGASGVTILGFFRGGGLGGRPRAPKFAPQWGRPSRRGRRKTDGDAALYGLWSSDPRVEELETDDDDDTDSQGVGLTTRRQARFVSDSLQFTGTDLGDRSGNVRRRYTYEDSEEGEDETSISSSEDDEDDEDEDEDEDEERYRRANQLAIRDREEALIQSALKRISRAQAKGRVDVKLNKEELAALERQRRRMQEEERRRNSAGSSSDRKKKQKERRVAVPLSQLEPVSRKKRSVHPPRQDSLPSHVAAEAGPRSNSPAQVYPPMGYFPPPSTVHSRAGRSRAGTRGAHEDYSPPVSFDYAARPSSGNRHASESSAWPHSRGLPHEENWVPHGNAVDPFQYQTAGPRVQYPRAPSTLSKRHSGGSDIVYAMHRQQQGSSSRSRHGSRRQSRSRLDDNETSEEQTSSDELGNGAQIREPPSTRGRGRGIVVEVSPEPEPAPSKKKSSSPTKRKSASGRKKKK